MIRVVEDLASPGRGHRLLPRVRTVRRGAHRAARRAGGQPLLAALFPRHEAFCGARSTVAQTGRTGLPYVCVRSHNGLAAKVVRQVDAGAHPLRQHEERERSPGPRRGTCGPPQIPRANSVRQARRARAGAGESWNLSGRPTERGLTVKAPGIAVPGPVLDSTVLTRTGARRTGRAWRLTSGRSGGCGSRRARGRRSAPMVEALCRSDADLATTRVVCDWIQYKANFRDTVMVRPVIAAAARRRARLRPAGRRLRARRGPAPLRAAGDGRRRRGDRGAVRRGTSPADRPGAGGRAAARGTGSGLSRGCPARPAASGGSTRCTGRPSPPGRRPPARSTSRRCPAASPTRATPPRPARSSSTCSRAGTSWRRGGRCPRSCTSSSSASATAGRRAPGWMSSSSSTAGTAATTTGGCTT